MKAEKVGKTKILFLPALFWGQEVLEPIFVTLAKKGSCQIIDRQYIIYDTLKDTHLASFLTPDEVKYQKSF